MGVKPRSLLSLSSNYQLGCNPSLGFAPCKGGTDHASQPALLHRASSACFRGTPACLPARPFISTGEALQFLGRDLGASPGSAEMHSVWLQCYHRPTEPGSPLCQGSHLFPADLDSSAVWTWWCESLCCPVQARPWLRMQMSVPTAAAEGQAVTPDPIAASTSWQTSRQAS